MVLNKLQETTSAAGTSGDASNDVPSEIERSTYQKEQEEKASERIARVNATWQAMNSGLPISRAPWKPKVKPAPSRNQQAKKSTPEWLVAMGLGPNKSTSSFGVVKRERKTSDLVNVDSEEAKRLAAAALSAVKEINSAAIAAKGRLEITEIKDFAGESIEVKKLVDPDSKEAASASAPASSSSPATALDNILDQIKKKQKLSVLDKTKKDWGEFKENKGLEEELDAYKKSSNQYLEKVSFLQRADVREFERERDVRLAVQSKRRPESMREDDDL